MAKTEVLRIELPEGTKERIQAATGGEMSVTEYCKQAVLDTLSMSHNAAVHNSQTARKDPTRAELEDMQAELNAYKARKGWIDAAFQDALKAANMPR